MKSVRAAMDLSELPDVTFGPSDIMWWGTAGFIVIEGWTLVMCGVVWIYLSQNTYAWPPQGTPLPSLLIPTIQVVLMLVSLPFVEWADRQMQTFDLNRARVIFTVASLVSMVMVALRVAELLVSLHVKWDANAYGSAQWLVIVYHGTLLLVECAEVIGVALMFWFAPVEDKHFTDGSDAMSYWKFMVLIWVPTYVLCYLVPRWA
jgi:cytochrome c oxidase subunit 3